MNKIFSYIIVSLGIVAFSACKDSDKNKDVEETILKGKATVVVDETLLPIIEDQKRVFESDYPAEITLVSKSENELVRYLVADSSKIGIMARTLTKDEINYFNSVKRFPKITPFAKDAIALVAQKGQDTTIALSDVFELLKTGKSSKMSALVFDNMNSGTIQHLLKMAGIEKAPESGVYSFKTNAEVLKFVSENPHSIGVVGINWIMQPTAEVKNYLKNVQVQYVQGLEKQGFFLPTQNNLAEGTYPLARQLYFINVQGYDGLGMGFASFIAGDRGQRLILKSGLLPERIPPRKIVVKKTL